MSDDQQRHLDLHRKTMDGMWALPWFDQPIVWSRRKRFVAWLRRRPLPTLTPREAQRLLNRHLADIMRYGERP